MNIQDLSTSTTAFLGIVNLFSLIAVAIWNKILARKAEQKLKEVHALVNGQRLGLLQTNLTSAMTLYEATKKPEHKELLEAAQRDLDTQKQALEHEKAIANGGTK